MVRFHRVKPLSATTPTMFTRILTVGRYGRFRTNFVTLPLISALVEEPETPQRYFVLPPEDPPEEAPLAPPKRKSFARRYRNLGEGLLE